MDKSMDQNVVRELIRDVRPGTKLKLTFLRDCVSDPYYLLGMKSAGLISFENEYVEDLIMAIGQSKTWGADQNRTITIIVAEKFDPEWFMDRIARRIEKLEIK